MARVIRQYGRALFLFLPLCALVAFFGLSRFGAEGSSAYVDPFWTNNAPNPGCSACNGCGCPSAPEYSEEGVNVRTGELIVSEKILSMPGTLAPLTLSLTRRSMVDGRTQMGKQWIPSWETTAEKVILDVSDPDGPGGHEYLVRRNDGGIVTYDWDGSSHSTADCLVTDTLTIAGGSGNAVLTTKTGEATYFDSNGMPDEYVDRNGNSIDLTYNSSRELTDIVDTRGLSYTVTSNSDGYITKIEDPVSREWTFTYTTDDNLATITTPATTDQPSGITRTFTYDTSDRLTEIEDGRGNTVFEYSWVGTTDQIDKVTIDSDDVDFTYASGITTRTDRNGNDHRYHWTGSLVTKTDMLVGGVSKYATEYHYSGTLLDHVVYTRGNRVDYTWDSLNNLTEKRRRTTNTSTNDSSDIVESWTYNSSNYMTGYTDALGNSWTYTVDTDGNRTGVTHPTVTSPASQTASTSTVFNSNGQVTSYTNEVGTVTTNSYYTSGPNAGLLEKTIVDPSGLAITSEYDYDSAGNASSFTDPRGNESTKTFDNLRRVTETQAPTPLNYKVKFNYDANSNLTKKQVENRDKDGVIDGVHPWITSEYTYTNLDQTSTVVEDLTSTTTRTTSHTYDDNGNRLITTLPEGNKVSSSYDERDLVATYVRGYGATGASTRTSTYDANGNLATVIDGRGNTTTYTSDLFDRQTKVTDPLGHYMLKTLDKGGNVTKLQRYSSANVELQRSTRFFDERGRQWKTSDLRKDPSTTYSDAVTTTTRLKTGQPSKITNALNEDTLFSYDAAGRRVEIEDAMGNVATLTLDDGGLVTATSLEEVDGAGSVTHEYEATYDVLGRKTSLTEIDHTNSSNELVTTFAFDSRSQRTFSVNAEGNPTRWTFDALGRQIKQEKAITLGGSIDDFTSAQVTEWGFDKNGRLASHRDDGANETTWSYDAHNRRIEMVYPDLSSVDWAYDKENNATQITDAAGNVIADTFDAMGRNTARAVSLASGFVGTTSETRSYDALGRMTSNHDNDYRLIFTHGVVGMKSVLYSERQEYATGSAYAKTVTKTYDALGRKITEAYPSGMNLDYAYNAAGAVSAITEGATTIASYTFVGTREKTATFENGTTQTNSFTGFRNELATIHHKDSSSATLVQLDYGYNDVHDRTYERFGGAGSSGDAFEYDKIRRLTKAWMGSSTPGNPVGNTYVELIDFNMDDDGNRSSKSVTPYGGGSSSMSYTTNSLNQYSAVGGSTYTYDDNGNLIDDGNQKYVYDYRNQLSEVRDSAMGFLIASYKYDAAGRRVEKDASAGNERFILSGPEIIEVCNGPSTWKQRFVYGQGIDKVVMLEQADVVDYDGDADVTELTRNFYHRNALGSVMFISEADETEAATYTYSPYGEREIERGGAAQSSDPLGQDIGYTGRWFDEESGLWQYRARSYSSKLGRFVQRDPLGLLTGPCLYEYAASSPLLWIDPSGLAEEAPPESVPPTDSELSTLGNHGGGPIGVRPGAGAKGFQRGSVLPSEVSAFGQPSEYTQTAYWETKPFWKIRKIHCPCGPTTEGGNLCREYLFTDHWKMQYHMVISNSQTFRLKEKENGVLRTLKDVGNVLKNLRKPGVGAFKALGDASKAQMRTISDNISLFEPTGWTGWKVKSIQPVRAPLAGDGDCYQGKIVRCNKALVQSNKKKCDAYGRNASTSPLPSQPKGTTTPK